MPAAFAVPAALDIGGGILKAVGSKQAGDANAAIDNSNTAIASQAAGVALQNGQQQAGMAAMRGSRTASSQKTGFAASGVTTSAGSALDVLGDTAAVSKQDQDVIQNNAARTAWGYNASAANWRTKANIDEQAGTSGAVGDILGGVTSAASSQGAMKLFGG